jgi:hypothetical protein
VGFLGEAVLEGKKSGRTGIDELERWWLGQKDSEFVPSTPAVL